jgi:hypothetical protein
MGADFKEKTKDTFKKCWDGAAVDARTPDLFAKPVGGKVVRLEADLKQGCVVSVDDRVVMRLESGKLLAFKGNAAVATIGSPTAEVVQAITRGCNVAEGTVRLVDPLSGVGEIEIVR